MMAAIAMTAKTKPATKTQRKTSATVEAGGAGMRGRHLDADTAALGRDA
jgi:hypothetical protein